MTPEETFTVRTLMEVESEKHIYDGNSDLIFRMNDKGLVLDIPDNNDIALVFNYRTKKEHDVDIKKFKLL
jgi:hypothetical protein